MRWSDKRSRALALGLVIASGLAITGSGCRHVPFYRMTNRVSQSLALSREGIAAYERGDLEIAEEKLADAVELNDSDVETCRFYGETLWKRGKRVRAMDVLRVAADKHGAVDSQISLYRSLGEKALVVERPDQTLIWANKIVDSSPKIADGWKLRGKAYCALGEKKAALADFRRAVYYEPNDRELLMEIASIQNEIGDYDSALATWQYLEQFYPTNREPAEVFAGKGAAYSGLGLLEDAQNAYEIAVRYAPEQAEYKMKLAQTALMRKDFKRANDVLADAVKFMPENVDLRNMLQLVQKENAQQVADVGLDTRRFR